MMLESLKHSASSFVTLTYDQDHLPEGGTLVPAHTQSWLKRLRKAISPRLVRYFLVGEYGEDSERPHYHAALFGIGLQEPEVIQNTWGLGFTHVGDLTKDSAQYVAGYVTKKMTKFDDPRLNGRHPEFARMSLKPGLGADAMVDVANALTTDAGCGFLARSGSVPAVLSHGGRAMPLGRYLRGKLFEKLGDPSVFKEEGKKAFESRMRELFEEVKARPKAPWSKHDPQRFARAVVHANEGRILSLENRLSIFSSKKGKL